MPVKPVNIKIFPYTLGWEQSPNIAYWVYKSPKILQELNMEPNISGTGYIVTPEVKQLQMMS